MGCSECHGDASWCSHYCKRIDDGKLRLLNSEINSGEIAIHVDDNTVGEESVVAIHTIAKTIWWQSARRKSLALPDDWGKRQEILWKILHPLGCRHSEELCLINREGRRDFRVGTRSQEMQSEGIILVPLINEMSRSF